MEFKDFFEKATGFQPYPYQRRLAEAENPPARLSVPTGLGKTAAALIGWLWRRRYAPPETRSTTPRRLVYCLPMRVLVEQTRDKAASWINELGLGGEVGVHTLMGGDVYADWDIFPERDAILVGTQDMLLSRALNRGYAMSRFRWPLQFGLLNNDCLWVMDEIQLMGSGLATTTQLQAFRRQLGTMRGVQSIWMSATMRPEWLETVDFELDGDAPGALALDETDHSHEKVKARIEAQKSIKESPFPASRDGKAEAELVLKAHAAGSRTLVVANTVKRAVAIHAALSRHKPNARLVLVHSRFRPQDRQAVVEQLLDEPGESGTIAVSTQVVEAGVDVSARTLFTDLAPWSSLVQRFGRCNRAGELKGASITWFDVETGKKSKTAPYDDGEIDSARERIRNLEDGAPCTLPEVDSALSTGHVVRRRDIVELFDTTPDLAGADIDVSRFIRETDDRAIQVFWRDLEEDKPSPEEPAPHRDELCSVPIGEAEDFFFKKRHPLWRWDHVEKRWERPQALFPGLVVMTRSDSGGYEDLVGWNPKSKKHVQPVAAPKRTSEANDDDHDAERAWQTIAEHTDAVVMEIERLIDACGVEDDFAVSLRNAARWHDTGKGHFQFQSAIIDRDGGKLWAKAPKMTRYEERPGFRHELASALAMLEHGLPDLDAYLAASHHGKVRLSIRSLPHERHPDETHKRFARGLWDGDELPAVDLGGGIEMPPTKIDLSFMELGEGPRGLSWLARAIALRDELGPFRLAYLEALIRVADWRASADKGVRDE